MTVALELLDRERASLRSQASTLEHDARAHHGRYLAAAEKAADAHARMAEIEREIIALTPAPGVA